MKCPVCVEEGVRSVLRANGLTYSTAKGGVERFYDEDGQLHIHDPNTVSSRYWCSNGHIVTREGISKCPAPTCDYGSMEWSFHTSDPTTTNKGEQPS